MTAATATPTVLVTDDSRVIFNAAQVRAAIKLYIGIKMIVARGASISKLLGAASMFTGTKYKNNEAGWKQAHDDLNKWLIDTKNRLGIQLSKHEL